MSLNQKLSKPHREAMFIGLGAALIAAVFWSPAFVSPFKTGFGDWQLYHHMWEAGYIALTRFGEWPLWDPYHCGGITIFGHPESQHLSPLFFISFLTGTTLASKIFVWVHTVAGIFGMVILVRREYRLDLSAASLSACIWATSGFFAWHGSGGHITFLPFYLTPWVFLAWRQAARDFRYSVLVAGLLTLILLEGGVYPFPFIVVLLVFDALARFIPSGQRREIIFAGGLSALLTALLSAIRLVPVVVELQRNPRNTAGDDSVTIFEIIEMLTARSHEWRYGSHEYVWPEYGTYVGWGVVILAGIGILLAWRTQRKHLVFGLLVFGGLVAGDHGPYSLWSLLHKLPPYDSLRVCSRFAVFLSFYLALLAGLSHEYLHSRWDSLRLVQSVPRVRKAAAWLVVLALTIDIFIVNLPINNRWKRAPIADSKTPYEKYHLTNQLSYGRWYASFPSLNVGTPLCYGGMNVKVAKGLWLGRRPQARITGTSGIVHDWGRTTSTAFAEVTLHGDGRVIFNQNWAPGWQTSVGRISKDRGRLTVDLPKGRHRISLEYFPSTIPIAVGISLLGIIAAIAVFLWINRISFRRFQS